LELANSAHRMRWDQLRSAGEIREVCDTLEDQLMELLVTRQPDLKQNPTALAEQVEVYVNGRDWEECGVWVWYPWRHTMVHVLDQEDFIELRTNRNRNRITREEQTLLRQKTVGIVGLSVGSSYALSLVMERSCGRLRLADFDTLELSNMNRIRTGIYSLGMPKGVVAAREITEIDPFFPVELHLNGFVAEQASSFMEGLDVVCDACDEVSVKARIRKEARQRKIPVIMETSDRGMLDVERYDLPDSIAPGYLHGRIDEETMNQLIVAPGWEPAYLDLFVDLSQASDRGLSSLQEIGQTLVGWPQLYSDVASGGAFATQATRKILLGQSMPDARLYLALDEQFSESVN
jgi:molybdopterin/thiamine biosynthesis adenylyltransferase